MARKFERVFRHVGVVEEVDAELAEVGDLALVEGLLRRDNRVRMLLRISERCCGLAALEGVPVHGKSDLRGSDEPGGDDLDRGEVPAVRLGLKLVDNRLDRDLLTKA